MKNTKALLDFCVENYALSRSSLLSQVGVTDSDLCEPQQRIAAKDYNHLMILAADQSNDSQFGQHFGAQLGSSAFNILGYLAMSASTLGEAALALQEYEALVSNIGHTTIHHEKTVSKIIWQAEPDCEQFTHHIVEAVFAGWISFGRKIVGTSAPINRIVFCHKKTDTRSTDRLPTFDCPIVYEQSINAIEIDKKWLALPLAQSQQAVYQALLFEAKKSIERINQATLPFKRQLENLITNNLYQGTLSLDTIATQLNVSRRTLQRRLKQENLSFRQMVEQAKKDIAIKLIKEDSLPLTSIAGMLGFSEQSAFTRAFKRWTGKIPKAYR